MSAICTIKRVKDNVYQGELMLGGSDARDAIRKFAGRLNISNRADPSELGFEVYVVTPALIEEFYRIHGKNLYSDSDPGIYEEIHKEVVEFLSRGGQFQFVINS